jgi:hypothetical protein
MHVPEYPATPAMVRGERRRLGVAQLDQGELGRDEETVEQHEQECRADVEQVLQHR